MKWIPSSFFVGSGIRDGKKSGSLINIPDPQPNARPPKTGGEWHWPFRPARRAWRSGQTARRSASPCGLPACRLHATKQFLKGLASRDFFKLFSGSKTDILQIIPTKLSTSVADPDPYVFGLPGSGAISQRYGSGSGSGTFNHHAKIVWKTLIPTILWLFLTFYLWKIM